MFSRSQLIKLAQAYIQHTGISTSALGDRATDRCNDRLFWRLFQGLDCYASSCEQASEFFITHWPNDLPWPLSQQPGSPCSDAAE